MSTDPSSFNIDPATLRRDVTQHDWLTSLYQAYRGELETLCSEMAAVRAGMVEAGYSADFSDAEAEVLYLLIRDLRPEVVVEMSPCHGYSTNYILAALHANRGGRLFSYELLEHVRGKPIDRVITGNLCSLADAERLELIVGNATKAEIPACDFLFMDSCHAAYFAAWYFSHLVHAPKLAMVHDIVVYDDERRAALPKAAFSGPREQYYVLQALAVNAIRCASVAEFASGAERVRGGLPRRSGLGGDRSIVFPGHDQSLTAAKLHNDQAMIHDVERSIIVGDRESAIAGINEITAGAGHPFSKLQAAALLPRMGYKQPFEPSMFPEVDLPPGSLTVSEFASALDLHTSAFNAAAAKRLLKAAASSSIEPAVRAYLASRYSKLVVAPSAGAGKLKKMAAALPGASKARRLLRKAA